MEREDEVGYLYQTPNEALTEAKVVAIMAQLSAHKDGREYVSGEDYQTAYRVLNRVVLKISAL